MVLKFERKYIPLANYFQEANSAEITLTFEALENIIGQPLPNAAYLNNSWWKKTKPPARHFFAWTEYDYYVKDVELARFVVFHKKGELEEVQDVISRNSDVLVIRHAEVDDARQIILLHKAIESQSDYMLFGKDERQISTQGMRKRIVDFKKSPNSFFFIALLNGEYAGFLVMLGQSAPKAVHRSSIVIGVKESFHRKGIATKLFNEAEKWALNANVSRMELTVVKENDKAIALYKKMGFLEEGVRVNSLKIHNQYVDELYMAKLL